MRRHVARLCVADRAGLRVIGERAGDGLLLGLGDEHLAVRPVPRRDLMAPPELARDAPRLDVLHPVEIGLLPVLRHEVGLALAHRGDGVDRQRLGVDVPLVGEERLDHHVGAVAVRHHVRVRLDLVDQAGVPPAARRRSCAPRSDRRRAASSSRRARPTSARRRGTPRCRSSVSLPSTSSTLTCGRSCRLPTSKSLKSCAGVIFTAPVPFSGSA